MTPYHLRKWESEITDQGRLREMLDNGRYMTIGLAHGDEPYVVTMNYGYDACRHAVYMHCAPAGVKLSFLEGNPRACATVIEDIGYRHGQCSHAYRSLVLFGTVRRVQDDAEVVYGLNILFEHLEKDPDAMRRRFLPGGGPYREVQVLRFDIEEMTGKQGG
ncbi:pyridoxamine 5'-phosphate oxidase family protein [bacterium]|nr:pyridoxamine 5'-phosphate oxidase family protein [candidate division CSSED10-310 bacterium]